MHQNIQCGLVSQESRLEGIDKTDTPLSALHRFPWPVVQDHLHVFKFRDKAKDESAEARAKALMAQQLPQDDGAAARL